MESCGLCMLCDLRVHGMKLKFDCKDGRETKVGRRDKGLTKRKLRYDQLFKLQNNASCRIMHK